MVLFYFVFLISDKTVSQLFTDKLIKFRPVRHSKHLALFNSSDFSEGELHSMKQVCKVLNQAYFALSTHSNKMGEV